MNAVVNVYLPGKRIAFLQMGAGDSKVGHPFLRLVTGLLLDLLENSRR
jgi:hypothetical protein